MGCNAIVVCVCMCRHLHPCVRDRGCPARWCLERNPLSPKQLPTPTSPDPAKIGVSFPLDNHITVWLSARFLCGAGLNTPPHNPSFLFSSTPLQSDGAISATHRNTACPIPLTVPRFTKASSKQKVKCATQVL